MTRITRTDDIATRITISKLIADIYRDHEGAVLVIFTCQQGRIIDLRIGGDFHRRLDAVLTSSQLLLALAGEAQIPV